MTMLRINEIFHSLQGEGHYTGTPAVFVRFAGCNLHCDFCDTNHTPYTEYTLEQLTREVHTTAPSTRHLIFTGGEPSLQLTQEIIDTFHSLGYCIHVETNGTRPLPEGIDWVTCSPKYSLPVIAHIDEMKVVFENTPESLQFIEQCTIIPARDYRLQPCYVPDDKQRQKIINATVDYILNHPHWNLSLQIHKYLGLR